MNILYEVEENAYHSTCLPALKFNVDHSFVKKQLSVTAHPRFKSFGFFSWSILGVTNST